MGSTTVRLGRKGVTFAAVELPELRDEPVVTPTARPSCRPTAAVPRCPRPPRAASSVRAVPRAPGVDDALAHGPRRRFEQLRARGASSSRGTGCTTTEGKLAAKAGLADFKQWYRTSFGRHTPWGASNSTAFVTAVETALERELAGSIMRAATSRRCASSKAGALLTEQGQPGNEVFLVLDGVIAVEVDGRRSPSSGPARSSASARCSKAAFARRPRAVTKCRVAVAQGDQLDRKVLEEISQWHRRENSV